MNSLARWGSLSLAVVLTVLAVGLRIWGITSVGFHLSDEAFYFSIAEKWLAGNFTMWSAQWDWVFYRPVLFFFQSLVLRIFGVHDYSLILLSGLMDLASGGMVYLCCRRLGLRREVALFAAVIHLLLAPNIYFSRSAMAHSLGTFLVLAGLWGGLSWFNNRKSGFAISAGVALGLAALTHADLALMLPGLLLFIWIASGESSKRVTLDKVKPAFYATLAFFGTLLAVDLLLEQPFFSLISGAPKSIHYSTDHGVATNFFRNWGCFASLTSTPFILSFLVAALYYGYTNRKHLHYALLLPILMIVCYLGLFSIFLKTHLWNLSRLALPALAVMLVLFSAVTLQRQRLRGGIFLCVLMVSLSYLGQTEKTALKFRPHATRETLGYLNTPVTRDKRIALTPHYNHRWFELFTSPSYLGKRAEVVCPSDLFVSQTQYDYVLLMKTGEPNSRSILEKMFKYLCPHAVQPTVEKLEEQLNIHRAKLVFSRVTNREHVLVYNLKSPYDRENVHAHLKKGGGEN